MYTVGNLVLVCTFQEIVLETQQLYIINIKNRKRSWGILAFVFLADSAVKEHQYNK